MDVGDWLRGLGLERYEAAFRENEIDERVLPSLTQEDLKEIGVGPVGHRRMLLEAVAVLRNDATGNAPSAGRANISNALDLNPENRAERRQVTVMFSDLVGSTALSARLDPEDMREVITAYQGVVAETIGRFGGFVAKYMGDGTLVYFGYPQAHEDDAERAVRAGLDLVAAVSGLKTHGALKARVGIATGLVVVGDLVGSGASQEQAIVGDTPNLAARLQGIAEPNSVVIAESTRRLVGSLFDLGDLGPQDLKGISGPARAWAALRPASVEGRFEAMHGSGLTDLVGREEELDSLLRRWSKAKSGNGQVALISGEAGIGKSRLTAALFGRLASEPHTRLRYFCSPQHTDSALHPIISHMNRAAGLRQSDDPQAKLNKLDALLAQSSTSLQDTTLIAGLLSLPNDGRYPELKLDPQLRRQKTLEALGDQIEALTHVNPVLIIFEDAHWSDPTSLEFQSRLVDVIASRRVLLLVTFRLEFSPPWIGQPHVTALTLNRLTRRDIDSLIEGVVGDRSLPVAIRQDIIERTDGIPLFVEEMTKAVLDAEGESELRRAVAAAPSPIVEVPASLHASLMARLDRLGPAKEVAQMGAAIGREFSYALAAVVREPQSEISSALDRLSAAGLLFRQGMPPHASYLFKHALVRDAAYGTLLRAHRQELHARIALAVRDQFFESAVAQPEILAHHFGAAAMVAEAVEYWIKAGEHARRQSANAEALAHFHKGLNLVPSLPDERSRFMSELTIQYAVGQVQMATKGYASVEAESAFRRAQELCEQVGDNDELMRISIGLRTLNQVQGKPKVAIEHASRCLEIAKQTRNRIYLAQANAGLAHTLCSMGCFALASNYLGEGFAADDPADNFTHQAISGWTPKIMCLSIKGWNDWFLGYPNSSLSAVLEAVALAEHIGFPQNTEQALSSAAHVHLLRREPDAALGYLNSAFSIARAQGFRMRIAVLQILRGWALSIRGEHREALRDLSEGLHDYQATGARAWQSNFLVVLANGYERAGMISEALSALAEASEVIDRQDERWWAAEVRRLEGDLLRMERGTPENKIERCYRSARETARDQQAKSWELRASISLARLWRDQGRRSEARDLLSPIYGRFTEGFETADLKEAKALLEELAV
jgi:class 3 adenylate cyclase/predicted ATPase